MTNRYTITGMIFLGISATLFAEGSNNCWVRYITVFCFGEMIYWWMLGISHSIVNSLKVI